MCIDGGRARVETDRRISLAQSVQPPREAVQERDHACGSAAGASGKASTSSPDSTSSLVAQSGGPSAADVYRSTDGHAESPARERRQGPRPTPLNPSAPTLTHHGRTPWGEGWRSWRGTARYLALRGRTGETPLLGHSPVASAVRQASTCARCEPGSCPSNAAGSGLTPTARRRSAGQCPHRSGQSRCRARSPTRTPPEPPDR